MVIYIKKYLLSYIKVPDSEPKEKALITTLRWISNPKGTPSQIF